MSRTALIVLLAAALSVSCTKKDAAMPTDGPHARVTLRDGSFLQGKVLESTAAQLTLAGDDGQSHTVSMSQVRGVEYDDPAPTAAPVQGSAQQPASTRPAPPVQRSVAQNNAPSQQEEPHENHYHPREEAIQTKSFVVPAGSPVSVRVEETIDSRKAAEGQTYAAELTKDVVDADGNVVLPRGANAQVVIRSAAGGGRFSGQSDLILDLETISVDGRLYQVAASSITEKGRQGVGANKRTAIFAGGGSAFGAIIGAIAGGGKGAAIGAASGAAAGLGTEVLTKGSAIRVPVESVLTFKLERPLRIESVR